MRGIKLMAVLAGPDEASTTLAGPLARSAAEGTETYVVLAKLGGAERTEVGRMIGALGVRETFLLGFDGVCLDEVAPALVVARLVEHIRLLRPEIVVTGSAEDAFLDPDRAALAGLVEAAVAAAGDPRYTVPSGRAPHHVWVVDTPASLGEAHALVA